MSDILGPIVFIFASIAVIFGFMFGIDKLVSISERGECKKMSELYEYPTRYYGTDKGCIMNVNGKKIRIAV